MKILSSYSIKGGVGKTALSVNLAYSLQQTGQRTLLMDLDPQGAAAFYFRVNPAEKFPFKGDAISPGGMRKNIRESDYPGLDILPSNLAYRNFDLLLDRMKKSRSRLRKVMEDIGEDYDVVVLDCPPNITLLSENVFRASDLLLVPVIPTVLSERTLDQLHTFFEEKDLDTASIIPFFSMVQVRHKMHLDIMEDLPKRFPSFLKTIIPHAASVEKMGLYRRPVLTFAASCPAGLAYQSLCAEIESLSIPS